MKYLLLAAACLVATPALADPTPDQQQTLKQNGFPLSFGFETNLPVGQSFTAGLSGQFLGMDVVSNYADTGTPTVTFGVWSGNGTGGTLLGSTTKTLGCDYQDGWCHLMLDASGMNIALTAGEQYTLAITGYAPDSEDWAERGLVGTYFSSYAGGQALAGPGYPNVDWDLAFTTYVDAAANTGGVPEPASWALMLGGFGLVGGALRHRRKAVAISI